METWKDVPGYEGLYQVSDLGRVKGVKRGKVLSPYTMKNGYLYVTLSKKSKEKCLPVHRLVAAAFVPNPEGKSEVNHIDANKLNAKASNLEWVTPKENTAHAKRMGLFPKQTTSKKVVRSDGKVFESIGEAARELKVNASNVAGICHGRQKTARGYSFRFFD